MSRTYIPNNKNASGNMSEGDYSVNSAGCSLLGEIHREIQVGEPFLDYFNPPFEASAEVCKETAVKIRGIPDARLSEIYQKNKCLFAGTLEDFREWVNDWAKFLDTCDGYEVLR